MAMQGPILKLRSTLKLRSLRGTDMTRRGLASRMHVRVLMLVAGSCATIVLAGCAAFSVSPYAVSSDTNAYLRDVHSKYPNVLVHVRTVDYPAGDQANIINCRAGGQISTPIGKPYSDYISDALVKELELAGLYSPDAGLGLSLNIAKIDFTSFPHGAWTIDGTVVLSDGGTYIVSTKLPFRTSYFGQAACDHVAAAFEPTVEQFISEIFENPAFVQAVAQSNGR